MTNFCTLFDSNYLTRGLTLYQSLTKTCKEFHLYVITFDDAAYQYLLNSKLPLLTPIALSDFEDEQLLSIKNTRSPAEYCWTCTPSVILYCIETFGIDQCTYVDADMIFYQHPGILLEEDKTASIFITRHNYTKSYDQSEISGIFCVQFMGFRNTKDGLEALRWWRQKCLEWCYAYAEDGKFGDQKYLDDWPSRFKGVHVIQHPGAGLAPWNVQQYNFSEINGSPWLKDKNTQASFPVIFYHFHGLKFYTDNILSLSGTLYEISDTVKRLFYFPYVRMLISLANDIQKSYPGIKMHGASSRSPSKQSALKAFIRERLIFIGKGKMSLFRLRNYNFARHYHFHKMDTIN